MEPNPHVIPTPRYAAVVVPDLKGGEIRLVFGVGDAKRGSLSTSTGSVHQA